jgi:hypothetical protein
MAEAPPPAPAKPSSSNGTRRGRGAQLDTAGVAQMVGIAPVTVRQHRRLGTMPAPDGFLGNRAWWWESTITAWKQTRRGRGRPPFAE